MRLSKGIQYGAEEKVDKFYPFGVINWGPKEKGETGCSEAWKHRGDRSARPLRTIRRSCRKNGKPAALPGS